MIDYLISGVIIIFIIVVLVWLRRREAREKLAAGAQAAQVAPENSPASASQNEPAAVSQNEPAAANQVVVDGQQRDDRRG